MPAVRMAIMVRICRVTLGTRLGTFLDGDGMPRAYVDSPGAADSAADRYTRPRDRAWWIEQNLGSHLRFSALAENKTDRNMEPFYHQRGVYRPRRDAGLGRRTTRARSFIYVLDGSRYEAALRTVITYTL